MTQVQYIVIMSFLSFVILLSVVLFVLLNLRSYYIKKYDVKNIEKRDQMGAQQWKDEQRPYIKEHKTYGKNPHKGPYNRKNSYRPGRNTNTNVQGPKDK